MHTTSIAFSHGWLPARSTIYYKKYDPTQPYMPFVDLYEEPFETAERIVQGSEGRLNDLLVTRMRGEVVLA